MQKCIVLYEDITLLENTSTQLPGENRSWFKKVFAKVLLDRKNGTSARNVVAGGENAGGVITALQSYPLLKTLR
ncbi:hypothetical protein T4A_9449 [Trichinella pseudospiralis]|uniref:Uncharacterized protein n=1 Tax=Trichinella pseudospiralis TaxID=6337 RepID=A0A0V1DT12_TRIPS|nr:hypothetical protein T4A_9449 [Trichinella pseudospiralis]